MEPWRWKRREDERLLTGTARFVADIDVPDRLDAVFVRSAVSHGRILDVDCSAARGVPGVVGAWSAADVAGLGDAAAGSPPDAAAQAVPTVYRTMFAGMSSEEAVAGREWSALAKERVRYAGEAVAVVVGGDRYRAEDGAAQVVPRIEPLPAVVSAADAARDEVRLFDSLSNIAVHGETGKPIDEAVWRQAAVVVEGRQRQQLLLPSPMECRTILAVPDGERLTVWAGHQMPHRLRQELATMLAWPVDRIRVIVPDTGGAFGSKTPAFPEFLMVALLAVRLGRPVRWIEDRLESLQAAARGRGQDQRVRLAADSDGRLLAYELSVEADVGAYPHLASGLPRQTITMATGPYATERVHGSFRSVLTNTMVTMPYRGAGRPEATIPLERMMEVLALRLDMDPAELRRRNFIPSESFPYDTPTGMRYDSGNYAGALDLALETVDYPAWRAEQSRRRQDPAALPLGIGISCYVERSGPLPGLYETGSIEVCEDGAIIARCGASPSGQGHETVFSDLVADVLGVDTKRVRVIEGDTDEQPEGRGSFGSRTAQMAGELLGRTAHLVMDEARERAAGSWDLTADEVDWVHGVLRARTGSAATLDVADLVRSTGPLRIESRSESETPTFPFGTDVAVAEVDPELGTVRVLRLVVVDDCGVVLNPMIVHGQSFGSAVQGIGQALYEGVPYGPDGTPLLANGLLDYLLPTFAEIPPMDVRQTCTPSPTTPLGAKGAGESGCIGTPAAIVNAVADALQLADPDVLQMPLTPDVVWRAARVARLEEVR
jgi:carbon-monoxide dehydrogenase large subunit